MFYFCFSKMCLVVKGTEILRNPRKHQFQSHVEHDLISPPLPLQARQERERRHIQHKQLARGLARPGQLEKAGAEDRDSECVRMSISCIPLNFPQRVT